MRQATGDPHCVSDTLQARALLADEGFLDRLARAMLDLCPDEVDAGDLSSVRVLVPALPLAGELRAAFLHAACRPVLLPHFGTLPHWVDSFSLPEVEAPLPDSERLLLLHEALRARGWFDEAALWGIAAEMLGLFDELSAAAIALPDSAEGLAMQLQNAYAVRVSAPLAFEARVVHELWRVLSTCGQADPTLCYRLRLSAVLRRSAAMREAAPRLLVLLDAAPDEALDAGERDFLQRYARIRPVSVFYPAPRAACASPLMTTLAAAWPESREEGGAPLAARARALSAGQSGSPLDGRLALVPAGGREQEAQAVVAQVAGWLHAGMRRIVLIAQDRLTARRVRALLERENVLVNDETGWKLSTSRAAATVDALMETAAGNAYYRDLLDLCKSPHVFSDCPENERRAAVFALESALRASSARSGIFRFRRCLQAAAECDGKTLGLTLLARVDAAITLLDAKPAPLAGWIVRLHKALEALGALVALRADAAGKALLELLQQRRQELQTNTALFSLASWRNWLDRELEAANFRDAGINSPIVLTPLNAACLRRFEAAVLIGGDARQMAPAAGGEFFNQGVRRELGLRTREDGERELRRDLELLLASVPRVTVTWQAEKDGEANLLSPDLALLSTLHYLAWQDDLYRTPGLARGDPRPEGPTRPEVTRQAAPAAPVALIPQRVSVSAYASLVACPYRFFVRHVLALGEMDEVSETMEKSDYGALVHRVLELFHERHPLLSDLPPGDDLSALRACVAEVFSGAVEENFLASGWRLRWERRLAAYLDWQRERETQGWRFAQAEVRVSRMLSLADGASIEFYGRIDRIDRLAGESAALSLLDYKTQSAASIRERLPDDVQLPSYALLHGHAAQAAYVALDDDKVVCVAAGETGGSLAEAGEAQQQRLQQAFSALRGGARMPAQGVDAVCRWCEMSGLCRKDFVSG